MKICIDPGHGGNDTGATGFGVKEKDINLDISLKLEKILNENGFIVFMTRKDDVTLSLIERAKLVNSFNCDINISIHNNAFASEKPNGSEVIYPYESEKGLILSQYILDNLGQLGLNKRRVYYRLNSNDKDYYYMIRNVNNLPIIVECAFISNQEDNELLKKEEFRYKIALAICEGFINYRKEVMPETLHWARASFERIKSKGIVKQEHDLESYVTWGEFAEVLARLLDII